jgi:hypothetical protein
MADGEPVIGFGDLICSSQASIIWSIVWICLHLRANGVDDLLRPS